MKIKAYSIYGFSFTLTDLIVHVTIIFIVVLWYYIKWNRKHIDKLASKLSGPKTYPIIGAAHNFFGSPEYIMKQIIKINKDHGPEPFKLWLGPKFCVVLMKPEDLQIVLNHSMALERGMVSDLFKNVVGNGVTVASVDVWKVHRRLLNPAFNINVLKQLLPVFNKKNKILIKNLQTEVDKLQPFDLWNYMSYTSMDTICESSMGYDAETELNSDYESFIRNLEKALELNTLRLYRPWYYPDIVFSIYLRLTGQHSIFDRIKDLPNRIIKKKKEIFAKKKNENILTVKNDEEKEKSIKNVLDILLELNDIGEYFTDEGVKDEIMALLIAGSETNAISNCLCLLLLAINQDAQNKVYNELYEVFGNGDQTCTYQDINRLVYLDQVLKETLRIFPVVPIFFRTLLGDVKIFSGNRTLPKGTECIISPISTHYMPELYPSPSTFNPENFNSENVAERHKYSFIPFGGGPRGCIGYKYAMLSMKVLLSTFLRNFSVHTDLKLNDIKFKLDVLMRSVDGYPMTIRSRNRIPTI